MSIADLYREISDEVSAILSSEFSIEVTNTDTVPHSGDSAITFPNFDEHWQGAKLIDTCVLYIDIRRSTELNLTHRPQTVAKLYSAFVRAMTRCARYHKGHVRGIIGDRVMVLFDQEDCFKNAVRCAFSMNSASKYVINKYFKSGEVECGIGIDAGKMLATKTGLRRRGQDQGSYRNLVWLGRPANIASKLTDLANKPQEGVNTPIVTATFVTAGLLGLGIPTGVRKYFSWDFVRLLGFDALSNRFSVGGGNLASFRVTDEFCETRSKTAEILMTEVVFVGYKAACPDENPVKKGLFSEVALRVPGYNGKVFAGNVIYPDFCKGA